MRELFLYLAYLNIYKLLLMEGTIGEIRMFASNFAPRTWAFCAGQLISISSNPALFSIIGTMYGGNGTTTFALPDFRGRSCVGPGQGPGLSFYDEGEMGGHPTTTLLLSNLPSHTHIKTGSISATVAMGAFDGNGNTAEPSGAVPAKSPGGELLYGTTTDATFSPTTTTSASNIMTVNNGSSYPFDNMPPYLVMNYIICLQGVFPSRN